MQQALDTNTLDRLVDLGRKRGQLTTADLRTTLPIETMSAEDIALIVLHLEETGIAVELEDGLLSPNPTPSPIPPQGAQIIPFPGPTRVPAKKKTMLSGGQPPVPLQRNPEEPSPALAPHAHWAVAAAGLAVLVAIALFAFLIAT